MSSLEISFASISVCILALATLYHYVQSTIFRRTLPPGPKGLPLLGNLFDMPATREYLSYAQWGKEYGDVVYVNVLGKNILVITSADAAKELLDARSAIYSDRPYVPMLHEPSLMNSNYSFVFKPYSSEWRRQRRLFALHLGPTASRAFFETQTSAAYTLLRSLLRSPEDLVAHLRHAAVQSVLSIAYGYQIQPTADPLVTLAEYAIKMVGEGALPGRFLVNIFPWLMHVPAWFPGAGFKTHAAAAREAEKKLVEIPFEDAKRRIAEGTALPSFVTSALTDPSPDDLMTDIQAVAATMYGAAADTTVSSIHACILALVLNPRIQVRAQLELDSVLGPPTSTLFRLPTLADRQNLPYIDAILKESLRWFSITPIAVPHSTTEDDLYRGWRIPKGTIVIANTWSMLRDTKTYSDPLVFRPERFLGENPEPHPGSQGAFGFGRRECPGQHLAESGLWIEIASLLSAFTFSTAKDKEGQDIDVNYATTPLPALILHPQCFPCTITPRSKELVMRILETSPDGA